MITPNELGSCPGCHHIPQVHAGGSCYDCDVFCGWSPTKTGWWDWSLAPYPGMEQMMAPNEKEDQSVDELIAAGKQLLDYALDS